MIEDNEIIAEAIRYGSTLEDDEGRTLEYDYAVDLWFCSDTGDAFENSDVLSMHVLRN